MALQDTDLLPLYRVSDSTNRKISVADLLSGAAGVWTEDSGKLYPNTLSNNVQIGGTAAAPNITLAADGTGSFTQVNSTNVNSSGIGTFNTGVDTRDITASGDVTVDGKVTGKLSPFGPVEPWRDPADEYVNTPAMKKIQQQ